MMNNEAKVIAFNDYYSQAKELYKKGDLSTSHELFSKAAALANDISLSSSIYQVKMDYHKVCVKILDFLNNDFGKKQTVVSQESNEENHESTFKPIENQEKITFDDVAGLKEVKDEIKFKVIEPLKNPELAKKYKITPGAKILLYGPPGTGKTYIARAIAGEVDAKFYSVNCQDLISKYMGDSSKKINELFDEAQKNKRAIIFFDEFDSIASRREDGLSSTDGEINRFVATFLTKVDGFEKKSTCEMLLLIAATNRPFALDPAMIRGGRFETHIFVGMPDFEARNFLINKEFKDIELDDDVSITTINNRLDGIGCADIVAICKQIINLAYRRSIESGKFEPITSSDVEKILKNIKIKEDQDFNLDMYKCFK